MHTVEAKCAVEVARFLRLKKFHVTSAPLWSPSDAIFGVARVTNIPVAHGDLKWREDRLNKIKLADWADVFAECRVAKQTIYGKGRDKISDHNPGSPPRGVPQSKGFVSPKEHDQ